MRRRLSAGKDVKFVRPAESEGRTPCPAENWAGSLDEEGSGHAETRRRRACCLSLGAKPSDPPHVQRALRPAQGGGRPAGGGLFGIAESAPHSRTKLRIGQYR